MKKLLLFPCLILALALGSCEEPEKDMRIELARPAPKVTPVLATAAVTWPAIPKTAGYAYKVDNAAEFTTVGADVTAVAISGLANGAHTLYMYSVGDDVHTLNSIESSVEFEINSALPTPEPSAKAGGAPGTLTVSWPAVAGADGYIYKINNGAEQTVGANVLSVDVPIVDEAADNTFTIRAKGKSPDSTDSPEKTIALLDTSRGVWVLSSSNGTPVRLAKDAVNNIYEAVIDLAKADQFEVFIEGETYGFLSFSGNGGVGTVVNANATSPAALSYYVRESVGRLEKKTAGGTINKLWTNVAANCQVLVRIDLTHVETGSGDDETSKNNPRYYLKLVEAADSSIVLEQYFDLMTLGGNWPNGTAGKMAQSSALTTIDGTEAATASAAATAFGVAIADAATNPTYIGYRGLDGWGVKDCFEFLGHIRLSNTNATAPQRGVLTTPPLEKLTAATTVTLTFDAMQFGASTTDVAVKVLGAGTITSAKVVPGYASASMNITLEAGNTSFLIKPEHCPVHAGGNASVKSWSAFTVTVSGATAATQLSWDCSGIAVSGNARLSLDNIVVKK